MWLRDPWVYESPPSVLLPLIKQWHWCFYCPETSQFQQPRKAAGLEPEAKGSKRTCLWAWRKSIPETQKHNVPDLKLWDIWEGAVGWRAVLILSLSLKAFKTNGL